MTAISKMNYNLRVMTGTTFPLTRFIIGPWILACFLISAQAQNTVKAEDEIPTPREEVFQTRGDLASPWRDSGCNRYAAAVREPACKLVTGDEWKKANEMTLYDLDGSVWHQFRLSANHTRRFL